MTNVWRYVVEKNIPEMRRIARTGAAAQRTESVLAGSGRQAFSCRSQVESGGGRKKKCLEDKDYELTRHAHF